MKYIALPLWIKPWVLVLGESQARPITVCTSCRHNQSVPLEPRSYPNNMFNSYILDSYQANICETLSPDNYSGGFLRHDPLIPSTLLVL